MESAGINSFRAKVLLFQWKSLSLSSFVFFCHFFGRNKPRQKLVAWVLSDDMFLVFFEIRSRAVSPGFLPHTVDCLDCFAWNDSA